MNALAVFTACAAARSIDIFLLDTDSGELTPSGSYQADHEVQCLAVSPDGDMLYAALRSAPSSVLALTVDRTNGSLTPAGNGELPAGMAYLSVTPDGRYLLAASYSDHLVSVTALGDDGGAGAAPASVESPGRHAHAVLPSPDGRFAYATSLGEDRVAWWPLDPESGTLQAAQRGQVAAEPGSGPRHLRFSASGERLYVLHEMSGDITVYARDTVSGALTEIARVSAIAPDLGLVPGRIRNGTGPEPDSNAVWCAELQLTPDGKFLYATERSSSTIAALTVDEESGTLTYLGHTPTQTQPRGMNISPDGRWLLACGEVSNGVSVYRIEADGSLALAGRRTSSAGPRWFEFSSLAG